MPGPAPNMPNIYDFNTTYDEMYKDLLRKDPELYPFQIEDLPKRKGKFSKRKSRNVVII